MAESINRNKRTEDRRRQILQAALSVFLEKGFSAATTKEIAKQAGVAEGTIFRYFKTKKDLLLELASPRIVESLSGVLKDVAGETDENILRAILTNRLQVINQNKGLIRLLLTEAQFHPEIRKEFVERVILKAAAVLKDFIEERVKEGKFKAVDPEISTRILVGMMGVFILWREYLQADKYISFDDNIVIDAVIEIFLKGIINWKGRGQAIEIG